MSRFNKGKPYHGSDEVEGGKLRGSTDRTDYFYFLCPRCADSQLLRILDYTLHSEEGTEFPYKDQVKRQPNRAFTLAFHLYCEKCKFEDFTKISNMGWQGGPLINAVGGSHA